MIRFKFFGCGFSGFFGPEAFRWAVSPGEHGSAPVWGRAAVPWATAGLVGFPLRPSQRCRPRGPARGLLPLTARRASVGVVSTQGERQSLRARSRGVLEARPTRHPPTSPPQPPLPTGAGPAPSQKVPLLLQASGIIIFRSHPHLVSSPRGPEVQE